MITCQSCHADVPDSSRFCISCGNPVDSHRGDDATIAIEPTVVTPPPSSAGASGVGMASRLQTTIPKVGRFHPGAILAGRYQIVGLLGRGGMGEVYRANDLTLDQPVALKFLPEGMAGNPAMLARFHGEVRIARQVSHPNVCRVYDIGEVDGQLFLSMEYVDGEDLSSLLHRIGRLPGDKGIEFARRICAGLAAAHDKGVLHRDLKPANIMIDSQGKVVIMDFGLAAVSDQVHGLEIKAGTPAYMSPEQLAGREVTIRSDIYALGLLLYEMFTGKRAFECGTLAELMQKQYQSQPVSLTSVVKDVDPAVETTILRCLSVDAKNRPASALAVAAALPGGDPLAAALAAGETPSPDIVAASGATAGMRPRWAILCGAAVLVGLIASAFMGEYVRVTSVVPLELPPEALTLKAREYAQSFGYTQKPVDSALGFTYDQDYLQFLSKQMKSPARWARLTSAEPAAVVFWYRQSPRYLQPMGSPTGQVTPGNPSPTLSGMLSLQLDPRGRMTSFEAVPPQLDDTPSPSAPMDWKPLFAAAGLDISQFRETRPQWTPLASDDTRAAWMGTWPDMPGQPLRVEAAAWKGRPVYFDIIGPWTRAWRMQPYQQSPQERATQIIVLTLAIGVLLGAALLARYNLSRGRGDRRGAFRLACFGFLLEMTLWILSGHHVPTDWEVVQLFLSVAMALLFAGAFWIGYVAVEPYVRRHWPQAIVSWSRLAAGGVRDPLVGRDVLIGCVFGVLWGCIWALNITINLPETGPEASVRLSAFMGPRQTAAMVLSIVTSSLVQLFISFFLLFALRLVARRPWLTATAYVVLFTTVSVLTSSTPLVDAPLALLVWASTYWAISRFGFITFVVAIYVNSLLVLMPVTSDFSVWYSGVSLFAMLLVAGLAAFGIYTTLAGHSLIEDELL